MAKPAFDRIMEGIDSAIAISTGNAAPESYQIHVPARIDVVHIRRNLGLTQAEFAAKFGISLHTLRKWEQEGREPEGPARTYLTVIERDPVAVERALRQANG